MSNKKDLKKIEQINRRYTLTSKPLVFLKPQSMIRHFSVKLGTFYLTPHLLGVRIGWVWM